MRKNIIAAALRGAAVLVSVIAVSNIFASCSGPLDASEDLDQLGVKAEKSVVDVEEFASVDAEQTSKLIFITSDGNRLTASAIGVTPERVELTPGAETANSRTINVKLIGRNDDGVTRVATTSYEQRKAAGNDEPAPVDPIVVDIRLEADTTMMYMTNREDGSNGAFCIIKPIRRITTYSNGEEKVDTLTKVDGLDSFLMGSKTHSDFITNSPNVSECVFWKGMTTERDTVVTYNLRGFQITERKQYVRLNISAISDANAECSVAPQIVVISRDVKFTDPESGKSIEWKSEGNVSFVSEQAINENREPLHEPEGDYAYKGTHKVTLSGTHNGCTFASYVATTAIYNK